MARRVFWPLLLVLAGALAAAGAWAGDDEPGAIDPFGPRSPSRADAVPGYVEMSNGTVHPGKLYLTRDHRLKIFDNAQKRFREIPLFVIRRIDCHVEKEWQEKEWRFKENASDEKIFTGRSYPVREYVHTITLSSGKNIRGPLSGIVYEQKSGQGKPERYLLHKRDKGRLGSKLKALLYVRAIRLGEKALQEGQRKALKKPATGTKRQ
jgi:hypothetical protein